MTDMIQGMELIESMIAEGDFSDIEKIVGRHPAMAFPSEIMGTDYFNTTKERVISQLSDFIGREDVVVIPCNSPSEAVMGYCIFSTTYESGSLCIGKRFAKPAESANTIVIDEQIPGWEEIVEECIDEKWEKCDDPKLLRVGFIKYAPLDSDEHTLLTYVRISAMKISTSEKIIKYLEAGKR